MTLRVLALVFIGAFAAHGEEPHRTPWTTSHVTGAPEPPPPDRTHRLFSKLTFKQPVDLTLAPGCDRWFVMEQMGKVYSFGPGADRPDLFFDLTTQVKTVARTPSASAVTGSYAITFHPDFARNHYCYILYLLASKKPGDHLPDGTRV